MRLMLFALLLFPFIVLGNPPGAVNPSVTQENINHTICVPGWTKIIRPPVSYTNKIKRDQIKALGLKDTNPSSYEEDHLISLQLGGSPTSKDNLWPEPYSGNCGARAKDKIETKLKRLVCSGKITLAEAQKEILSDWVTSYNRHIGKLICN